MPLGLPDLPVAIIRFGNQFFPNGKKLEILDLGLFIPVGE